MVNFYNIDNLEFMRQKPDKYYDLAIVDPPYGLKQDGKSNHSRGKLAKPKLYTPKDWDKQTPPHEYFEELFRVSVNQIIFGGNYFLNELSPTPCFIVWDKNNSGDFADCELAWTSFNTAVRKFKWTWNGMLQENMKNKQERIHPTEKPIELYRWCLQHYAEKGMKILDTHGGSMSIAIAADIEGFDLDITEIDKEYFGAGVKRYKMHKRQLKLF